MSVASLALRNLARQKRRTLLLGGAIAFGVLAATLVNGFTGGLVLNIEANVAKIVAGHLFAASLSKDANNRTIMVMTDDAPLRRAAASLRVPVAYTQVRTQLQATLVFESNTLGRTVEGVDWDHDLFLTRSLRLKAGSLADLGAPRAALLSSKQADKLGLRLGEEFFIQTQTIHGQQNFDAFLVKGIYDDSGSSVSSSVYISLADADKLADLPPGSFNIFGVTLERLSDADAALTQFLAALPPDLRQMDRALTRGQSANDLFAKFKKNKADKGPLLVVTNVNDELAGIKGQIMAVNTLALAVLCLLLLVVMVGLTNTYRIIVFERSREIGTMRALGMQRAQVQRLFVLEAVFLSLGGAGGGIVLASLLLSVASLWNFGDVNSALAFILSDGHLSWRLDPLTLALTTGLVAGMTWLAALLPSRRAGRVDPAEALRTTA